MGVTDLLLAPHNDDETLFCSWTIIEHRPHVVICLKSQVQEDRYGILDTTREAETNRALWHLGCPSWEQSEILDTDPRMKERLMEMFLKLDARHSPERVWRPAHEDGGHEQHNMVAEYAHLVFGKRSIPYMTYVRGALSTRRNEVPFKPGWVRAKLKAMSCYESQIELENTQPWFLDDTLREYRP